MKGKKKSRKAAMVDMPPIAYKEPTPAERVNRAAEHLVQTAIETHPTFKRAAKALGTKVRAKAGHLIRGLHSTESL